MDRPGLELKDVRGALTGQDSGATQLTAHAASGKGKINIDGTVDFRASAASANFHVKEETFTILDTSMVTVETSPDVHIWLRENQYRVAGEVAIPKARIQLKKVPESAVKVSKDQTIVKAEGQVEVDRMQNRMMDARVRVNLGQEVFSSGLGLDGRIESSVLVIEKPGEPTMGSGELNIVDGSYAAYGQKLAIERGRVLFVGGPIRQPGIDVRAVRRPDQDIAVAVIVRGGLAQPTLSLFSEPAMTQGNQLSYLVL